LRTLREDLQSREERFKTTFRLSWEIVDVRVAHGSATVSVTLTLSAVVDGFKQDDRQPWRFVTQLGKDWRVCSAGRAG
jgi:hypothetical protein